LRQEWVKNWLKNEVKNQAWNNEKMQILFKWAIHTRIDSVNLMKIIKTHTRKTKSNVWKVYSDFYTLYFRSK
jgi:hypothetical protein